MVWSSIAGLIFLGIIIVLLIEDVVVGLKKKKVSKQFAWLPTRVTSGRWTWLTTYYQHKSLYDETTGRPPLNSLHFIWTETASEQTWRVLKETAIHNRNVWNDVKLTQEDKL